MSKRVDLDVRPYPSPVRKNYDYGEGLYGGKFKYKSVRDFLNKRKKLRDKKITIAINNFVELVKKAIFNNDWAESSNLPNTNKIGYKFYPYLSDLYEKYYKYRISTSEINELFINSIIELAQKIIKPNSRLSFDYFYLDREFSSTRLETFFHDLVHECLEPGISEDFNDPLEEDNRGFNLRNYMSEHQAQFVGNSGDTIWLNYGLNNFFDVGGEFETFILLKVLPMWTLNKDPNLEDSETVKNILNKIINFINEQKIELQEHLHPIIDHLIINIIKKEFYLFLKKAQNYDRINFNIEFKDFLQHDFINHVRISVKKKFFELQNKNINKNILSEEQLAIANRIKIFFSLLENRSEKIMEAVENQLKLLVEENQ